MRFLTISTVLASLAALTAAKSGDDYRPIVFYHGMGDSAHSKGMVELMQSIKDIAPEVFIHSVSVSFSGEKYNGIISGHSSNRNIVFIFLYFFWGTPSQLAESESDDQRAGFFGNVNNQVCSLTFIKHRPYPWRGTTRS